MASSRRSAKSADRPAGLSVNEAVQAALESVETEAQALGQIGAAALPVAVVAFSGGLDSTVLLHALAARVPPARLLAVHVHHGLQAAASGWPAHCARVAEALGVAFICKRLSERPASGTSLEAWARDARYAALAEAAAQAGCRTVFTAHHADDQAETVLLRLARGAGMLGMGAMSMQRPMAGLNLVRPLLSLPRGDLLAYAQAESLQWVEDPSNQHTDRARNQVRAVVLPALQQAVPGARENLVRAAGLAREAQAVLVEVGHADLQAARLAATSRLSGEGAALVALLSRADVAPVLYRQALCALSAPRQRLALRAWMAECGLAPPSQSVLAEMGKQLLQSSGPYGEVHREGHVMRRYREWIWVQQGVRSLPTVQVVDGLPWRGEAELRLADARLLFTPAPDGISETRLRAATLSVRPLSSSTRVRLRAGGPSRSLKHWHQQFGVPAPWRASLPGVFAGDRLLFVAGLGSHHEADGDGGGAVSSGARFAVRWQPDDPGDFRHCLCAPQQVGRSRV